MSQAKLPVFNGETENIPIENKAVALNPEGEVGQALKAACQPPTGDVKQNRNAVAVAEMQWW